jgi:hypothetical protein
MSYLGAAKDVILQLLHFVDLDINLVSEVPGLLYFLEKLLHVTCEIEQTLINSLLYIFLDGRDYSGESALQYFTVDLSIIPIAIAQKRVPIKHGGHRDSHALTI